MPSRIKIITPSYIAKIDAQGINSEASKSGIKTYANLITLWATKENAIKEKYTHTNRIWQRFERQFYVGFYTKTIEQTNKILETFKKAQLPKAKNYTIHLETPGHKFEITEY